MRLSELGPIELARRLHQSELVLRAGPFNFRLVSAIDSIAEGLALLYADYPLVAPDDFADFTVTLAHAAGLRRFWRPQVQFVYDGDHPFMPLPIDHAFPLLEWSMNWCISTQAHHYLTLHSAVIEREGGAVIMPAPPGSGKSTLCAALVSRGWRLLSDELGLISLTDGSVVPLCRPVSLKNESLQIIRNFVPDAVLNRVAHDTSKGSVSHMRVAPEHLERIDETAMPRWVVFPKYEAGSAPRLTRRSKADSLLELGRNSFNYSVLGLQGYEVLSRLISGCDCYDFIYSRLDDAIAEFDRLSRTAANGAPP